MTKVTIHREPNTGALSFASIFSGVGFNPRTREDVDLKASRSITTIELPEGSRLVECTTHGGLVRLPDSTGLNDSGVDLVDARRLLAMARESRHGVRFSSRS